MSLDSTFQRLWYQSKPLWLRLLLWPLSCVFAACVRLRRTAYRVGLFHAVKVGKPVIVVGNITVGGTGKTPFVMWLAGLLRLHGWRVGIVLRGYGGASTQWPRTVSPQTDPREVGDEAVLIAARTGAIVVAAPDRVAAARKAIESGADVVLADDGLQHYRLARDCEFAVVDEQRGLGNGHLLPAGPLREPSSRLRGVNLIVRTRRSTAVSPATPHCESQHIVATSRLGAVVALAGSATRTLDSFRPGPVHAIAGIGNPEAFFAGLAQAGLQVLPHPLPDHAPIRPEDIGFADDLPVLMTHKDAVKCRALVATQPMGRYWAVDLELEVSEADIATVAVLLEHILGSRTPKQ